MLADDMMMASIITVRLHNYITKMKYFMSLYIQIDSSYKNYLHMEDVDAVLLLLSSFLFFIVLLLLVIRALYFEWEQIKYHISCAWGHHHSAGLPTPPHALKHALSYLSNVPEECCIIDFGSGNGHFLHQVHQTFPSKTLIGVELDVAAAQRSREKFDDIPQITIITADMSTYRFPNQPTLLYMYEPLWTLKDDDAFPIYRSVLQHLLNEVDRKHPVYVLYISGIHAMLDANFFAPMHVIAHDRVERFIGCNHIWLIVRADDFLIQ